MNEDKLIGDSMRPKVRLIARLDVKNNYLVKGVHLEGLRKMGDPNSYATDYYDQGADEILYMDIVASLYNRNSLGDIIKRTTRDVFVPIAVGGGLRGIEDVRNVLKLGADKVAINTAAIKNERIISKVAETFGSQCMMLSVEAKRRPGITGWEAYYDNGREHSGKDVVEWARRGVELGAGEILLTSVDQEGTEHGMDFDLIKEVCSAVDVPVIVSGGCRGAEDIAEAAWSGASAVAAASVLHYKKTNVRSLKERTLTKGVNIRL
jgi:cyclase